jgi:hypothetical protein
MLLLPLLRAARSCEGMRRERERESSVSRARASVHEQKQKSGVVLELPTFVVSCCFQALTKEVVFGDFTELACTRI